MVLPEFSGQNGAMKHHRSLLGAALLSLALLPASHHAGAASSGIVHASHRAYYEIAIGEVSPKASVIDASGGMVAEWSQGCDGWTSNQRLVMTMAQSGGGSFESSVSMSSYESIDGTLYRFDSRTQIGDETVEEVSGRAERPGPGQPGQAVYKVPEGLTLDLPADTLFPFEHTLFVLDAAKGGGGMAFAHYFDGSQPEISPMTASALILGDARQASEGDVPDLGPVVEHPWWPVRMAWFAAGDKAEQPEFEVSQDIQDNGVVRSFEFDYGDFTVRADLVRIELLDAPDCR